MAMSATSQNGAVGRRRRSRRNRPMSEINVTPFVDVMLVLLIIFMVAAPLLLASVPIDLPKIESEAPNVESEPLNVSVDRDGKIFIQQTEVSLNELAAKLRAISKAGYDQRIWVKGHEFAYYGVVLNVLSEIRRGGFEKLALIGLPKDSESAIPLSQGD